MITLEFSARAGKLGGLVQAVTWSPYSHVDFVLADGRLLGAVPQGGVCERDWTPAERSERFHVDAPAAVLEIARSQLGRPYDWIGAVGIGLMRDWHRPDAWICSELVAWAFRQAGRPLLRADHLRRVTPRDVRLSPLLISAPPRVG